MEKNKPTPHGTITGYNARGCRCQKCREAWALYMRNYKRNRFGVRERQSFYADAEPSPIPIRLTALGKSILDAAAARNSRRRNDVIERLLREHGVNLASSALGGETVEA